MSDDEKKNKNNKIKARSRKPYGSSFSSRLNQLEKLIAKAREVLDPPPPPKVVFWNPKFPEPEVGENDIIVRFVPEQNIKRETLEKIADGAEKREAAKAEREPISQEKIELNHPDPAPAQAGAHTHYGDQVIYEGYGVRWGKFPPLKERHRNFNPNRDWGRLNQSGII